jgi:hypothetical protein
MNLAFLRLETGKAITNNGKHGIKMNCETITGISMENNNSIVNITIDGLLLCSPAIVWAIIKIKGVSMGIFILIFVLTATIAAAGGFIMITIAFRKKEKQSRFVHESAMYSLKPTKEQQSGL